MQLCTTLIHASQTEERSALGKLKYSDNVFRIQDKGPRFVIISQNKYQDKMLAQLNNDLHCNKLYPFTTRATKSGQPEKRYYS